MTKLRACFHPIILGLVLGSIAWFVFQAVSKPLIKFINQVDVVATDIQTDIKNEEYKNGR